MLPILLTFCSSKNVPVRRKVFALLDIVLQWPSTMLEKHILELKKSLVQGNLDADSETRVEARKFVIDFYLFITVKSVSKLIDMFWRATLKLKKKKLSFYFSSLLFVINNNYLQVFRSSK